MEAQATNAVSSLVQAEFTTLQIAAGIFLLGTLISLAYWFSRREGIGTASWIISLIATLTLTASLVLRYINIGHIPYIKMYETYLFLSWAVALVAVIADPWLKTRIPSTTANLLIGLTLVYIIQWPAISKESAPLSAALQSPWLDAHIATAFLSYAGFAISAGASVAYLIKPNPKFDELAYRLVAFAFPLLALGIILGAVWANEAWGKYWQWDPKETAALVTWLVYAGYLHARMVFGWKGKKAAILNLIGFLCVIFTWVGLSILSRYIETTSLHTYTG
jgi:ABC-type transport system involved in cytochrome c biogenesis permease subunit